MTKKTESEQSESGATEGNGNGPHQASGLGLDQAGGGTAGNQALAPGLDRIAVLGHALWLMSHSPLHKYFFVADLEWMLVPPIVQGQFRLWMDKGRPEGFATWAFVSDSVEARLKQGTNRLGPQEWKCGSHLWLIDMVIPFGGQENALKDLHASVFQDRRLKTLRLNPTTKKMELAEV